MALNDPFLRAVTTLTACLLVVGSTAGCASSPRATPGSTPAASTKSKPASPKETSHPQVVRRPPSQKLSIVDTAESPFGRVVTSNLLLKFVVIDFSLRPMPGIGQTMHLYRNGQRVGDVRISGPVLDGHTVADISAGDAQAGDEARVD